MPLYAAHARRAARLAIGIGLVAACAEGRGTLDEGEIGGERADSAAGVAGTPPTGAPTLVGVTRGFQLPESALHDDEQDVYFVSNIGGANPSAKDGNGFIARVHPDSLRAPNLTFVRGGAPRTTLHAPKGMAITGDTLWVADIDAVRGFNRHTGRPVGTVDLTTLGAVFLNDIAVGPDGTLYVTDTGIRFADNGTVSRIGTGRIFAIVQRVPTVAVDGEILAGPNGIAWDSAGARLVIAPFNGPTLLAWAPAGRAPNPRRLAAGPGSYDGLAVLPGNRLLVSTWADSSLYLVHGDSAMTKLIAGIESPADFGVDRQRNRLLIPLFNEGRVVVYEVEELLRPEEPGDEG